MTEEFVIGIARDTFYTVFIVSAPVLLVSVVVGLLISIFQAATSISEMTLTFVPKIISDRRRPDITSSVYDGKVSRFHKTYF